MHRGARKHTLDGTAQPGFLEELGDLLVPCPVEVSGNVRFMPS